MSKRLQVILDDEEMRAIVRAAAKHAFPTAHMDRMLEEIESGYQSGATS